jgi:hypothetical protein
LCICLLLAFLVWASRFGLQTSLQNVQSSLFHDAVKVIAIKPKMVLFENVHSILSAAHRDDLSRRQWPTSDTTWWTTCSASTSVYLTVGSVVRVVYHEGETFNELIVPESVHMTRTNLERCSNQVPQQKVQEHHCTHGSKTSIFQTVHRISDTKCRILLSFGPAHTL